MMPLNVWMEYCNMLYVLYDSSNELYLTVDLQDRTHVIGWVNCVENIEDGSIWYSFYTDDISRMENRMRDGFNSIDLHDDMLMMVSKELYDLDNMWVVPFLI